MPDFISLFAWYLIIINGISVLSVVVDKLFAVQRNRRIPEALFFFLSLLGGTVGVYLTMCLIRHKTRKKQFMLGLPLLFLFQMAFILWILFSSSLFPGFFQV